MAIEIIWTIAKAICMVMAAGTGCFCLGCMFYSLYKYIVR